MNKLAQDEGRAQESVLSSLVVIFFVALLWIALFKINNLFSTWIGFSKYIAWIFLPAAIRMLSVLVFEWVGAIGLFFGALFTSEPFTGDSFSTALVISSLSALGPVFAVAICTKWLNLPRTLHGIGPRQICLYSLMGATFNVIPHNLFLYGAGYMPNPFTGILPMFIGDLAGTAIVIYLTSLILKLWMPAARV